MVDLERKPKELPKKNIFGNFKNYLNKAKWFALTTFFSFLATDRIGANIPLQEPVPIVSEIMQTGTGLEGKLFAPPGNVITQGNVIINNIEKEEKELDKLIKSTFDYFVYRTKKRYDCLIEIGRNAGDRAENTYEMLKNVQKTFYFVPECFVHISKITKNKTDRAFSYLRFEGEIIKNQPEKVVEMFEKYKTSVADLISIFGNDSVEIFDKYEKYLERIKQTNNNSENHFDVLRNVRFSFFNNPEEITKLIEKYKNNSNSLTFAFKEDTIDIEKKYEKYIKRIIKTEKGKALFTLNCLKEEFLNYPEEITKIAELSKENADISIGNLAMYKLKTNFSKNPEFFLDIAKKYEENTYQIFNILNLIFDEKLFLQKSEQQLEIAEKIFSEKNYDVDDLKQIKKLFETSPEKAYEIAKNSSSSFLIDLGQEIIDSKDSLFSKNPEFITEISRMFKENQNNIKLIYKATSKNSKDLALNKSEDLLKFIKKYGKNSFQLINSFGEDTLDIGEKYQKYLEEIKDIVGDDAFLGFKYIKTLFKKEPQAIVDITKKIKENLLLSQAYLKKASDNFLRNPEKFVEIADALGENSYLIYNYLGNVKSMINDIVKNELIGKDFDKFINFLKISKNNIHDWMYDFIEPGGEFNQIYDILEITGEETSPDLLNKKSIHSIEEKIEHLKELKEAGVPLIKLYKELGISQFQRYDKDVLKHIYSTLDDLINNRINKNEKITFVIADVWDYNGAYENFSMWNRELKKFIENGERVILFETNEKSDIKKHFKYLNKLMINPLTKKVKNKISRNIFAGHGNRNEVGKISKSDLAYIQYMLTPLLGKDSEFILEGCKNAEGADNIFEKFTKSFPKNKVYAQKKSGGMSIIPTPVGTINGSQVHESILSSSDGYIKGHYDSEDRQIKEVEDFENYFLFETLFKKELTGIIASLGFEECKFDLEYKSDILDFKFNQTIDKLFGLINLGFEANYSNGKQTLMPSSDNSMGFKAYAFLPDGSPELINRSVSDWFYPTIYLDMGGEKSLDSEDFVFNFTTAGYFQINKIFDLPAGLDILTSYKLQKNSSNFIDQSRLGIGMYLELGKIRLEGGVDFISYNESQKGLLKENGLPESHTIKYHGAIEFYLTEGEGIEKKPIRLKLCGKYDTKQKELSFGFMLNIKHFGEIIDKLKE